MKKATAPPPFWSDETLDRYMCEMVQHEKLRAVCNRTLPPTQGAQAALRAVVRALALPADTPPHIHVVAKQRYRQLWRHLACEHIRFPDATNRARAAAPRWMVEVDAKIGVLHSIMTTEYLVEYSDLLHQLAADALEPTPPPPLWASVSALVLLKLRYLCCHGDLLPSPTPHAGTQLSHAEWQVADVALLLEPYAEWTVVYSETPLGEPARQLVRLALRYQLAEPAPKELRKRRWVSAYREYISSGRLCSLVLLQRRWHVLALDARAAFAAARTPHTLHWALAARWPQLVTQPLASWRQLVRAGDVFHLQDHEMSLIESVPPLDYEGCDDALLDASARDGQEKLAKTYSFVEDELTARLWMYNKQARLNAPGQYTHATIQQPYIQQPAIQQPAIQQSTIQQPTIQQPTIQQPTMQQSTIQQPTIQQPAIQQPTIQQSTIQQPTIQQPTIQQSNIQQPTIQQLTIQQPTIQQPTIQQPSIQQPTIHKEMSSQPEIPSDKEPTEHSARQILQFQIQQNDTLSMYAQGSLLHIVGTSAHDKADDTIKALESIDPSKAETTVTFDSDDDEYGLCVDESKEQVWNEINASSDRTDANEGDGVGMVDRLLLTAMSRLKNEIKKDFGIIDNANVDPSAEIKKTLSKIKNESNLLLDNVGKKAPCDVGSKIDIPLTRTTCDTDQSSSLIKKFLFDLKREENLLDNSELETQGIRIKFEDDLEDFDVALDGASAGAASSDESLPSGDNVDPKLLLETRVMLRRLEQDTCLGGLTRNQEDTYLGSHIDDLPEIRSSEPLAEPCEPLAEPSEPLAEPSEPLAEPPEPLAEPSEPLAEPSEPSEPSGPSEPAKEPFKLFEPSEPLEPPPPPESSAAAAARLCCPLEVRLERMRPQELNTYVCYRSARRPVSLPQRAGAGAPPLPVAPVKPRRMHREDEGGVLTLSELAALIRKERGERRQRARTGRRTAWCCGARRDAALTDARRRAPSRRPLASATAAHRSWHGASCSCCCASLLRDAAPPLTELLQRGIRVRRELRQAKMNADCINHKTKAPDDVELAVASSPSPSPEERSLVIDTDERPRRDRDHDRDWRPGAVNLRRGAKRDGKHLAKQDGKHLAKQDGKHLAKKHIRNKKKKRIRTKKKPIELTVSEDSKPTTDYEEWMRQRNDIKKYFTIRAVSAGGGGRAVKGGGAAAGDVTGTSQSKESPATAPISPAAAAGADGRPPAVSSQPCHNPLLLIANMMESSGGAVVVEALPRGGDLASVLPLTADNVALHNGEAKGSSSVTVVRLSRTGELTVSSLKRGPKQKRVSTIDLTKDEETAPLPKLPRLAPLPPVPQLLPLARLPRLQRPGNSAPPTASAPPVVRHFLKLATHNLPTPSLSFQYTPPTLTIQHSTPTLTVPRPTLTMTVPHLSPTPTIPQPTPTLAGPPSVVAKRRKTPNQTEEICPSQSRPSITSPPTNKVFPSLQTTAPCIKVKELSSLMPSARDATADSYSISSPPRLDLPNPRVYSAPAKSSLSIVETPAKSNLGVDQTPAKSNLGVDQTPAKSNLGVDQTPAKSNLGVVQTPAKSNFGVVQTPAKSNMGVVQTPAKSNMGVVQTPAKSNMGVVQTLAKSNMGVVQTPAKSNMGVVQTPAKSNMGVVQTPAKSNLDVIQMPAEASKVEVFTGKSGCTVTDTPIIIGSSTLTKISTAKIISSVKTDSPTKIGPSAEAIFYPKTDSPAKTMFSATTESPANVDYSAETDPPAKAFLKKVTLLPVKKLDRPRLPRRRPAEDKGTFGHIPCPPVIARFNQKRAAHAAPAPTPTPTPTPEHQCQTSHR